MNSLHVLLAEDNAGDVFLIREALRAHRLDYELCILTDGTEAARYLDKIGTSPGVPCPKYSWLTSIFPAATGTIFLRCSAIIPSARSFRWSWSHLPMRPATACAHRNWERTRISANLQT
jgi:hypothetical protein